MKLRDQGVLNPQHGIAALLRLGAEVGRGLQRLLREPSPRPVPAAAPEGPISHNEIVSLFEKLTREVDAHYLNGPFVKPELQREFEARGYHLLKDHFYSPIPRLSCQQQIADDQPIFADALALADGSRFDLLFDQVLQHATQLAELPRSADQGFYWNNPMFPPLDAAVYFGLIRERRPKRIIEIGCGFSTEIALLAARDLPELQLECIEPFPSERFKLLLPRISQFTEKPIQDVPLEYFSRLAAGDILFVDTTHVVKRGSDINHIVFQILPRLAPGVIVHIHDIFLPYEYPQRWLQEIGIMWNEQYLVLGLLLANSRFKPLLLNYFLSKRHRTKLQERFAHFDIWNLTENLGGAQGASLWFQVNA